MKKIIFGRRGENCATYYLESSGYRIINRNCRLGKKELDIVAQKSGTLCFFEIKTRFSSKISTTDSPISKKQMTNLKKAALSYAASLMVPPKKISFDLIIVYADPKENKASLVHYYNIF